MDGGKQRLTATRLHALLVAERHAVGVRAVKAAVAEWKRQRRDVFVPLTYRPGDIVLSESVPAPTPVPRWCHRGLLHGLQAEESAARGVSTLPASRPQTRQRVGSKRHPEHEAPIPAPGRLVTRSRRRIYEGRRPRSLHETSAVGAMWPPHAVPRESLSSIAVHQVPIRGRGT